jgi:hypothetical protein
LPGEIFLHQVRDHFGVGLGFENVPFFFQLVFQRQIVFDDAVVDHDNIA